MSNSKRSPYILKRVLFFMFFCNFSMLYAQLDSLAHKSYEDLDSLYLMYRYNNPKKANIYADELYAKAQVIKDDKKHIVQKLFSSKDLTKAILKELKRAQNNSRMVKIQYNDDNTIISITVL